MQGDAGHFLLCGTRDEELYLEGVGAVHSQVDVPRDGRRLEQRRLALPTSVLPYS
jgi:hypothetical protein